jgi:Protein of unknown function (DUF664)
MSSTEDPQQHHQATAATTTAETAETTETTRTTQTTAEPPPAARTRRADMFLDADRDPRENGQRLGDERATLVEYLRCQRLTLELKCSGLGASDLARRAVEPSTMSLLELVRHLADVERGWFRRVMAGQDAPPHFRSDAEPDGDFDGAVADPDVVAQAWQVWRAEVAFAEVRRRRPRPRHHR